MNRLYDRPCSLLQSTQWGNRIICAAIVFLLTLAFAGQAPADLWPPAYSPQYTTAVGKNITSPYTTNLFRWIGSEPAETAKIISVNQVLQLRVAAIDTDEYTDPYPCDWPYTSIIYSWEVKLNGSTVQTYTGDTFNFSKSTCGSYTITCNAADPPYPSAGDDTVHPAEKSWTITVVDVDIDTDSNNDGAIDSQDDPIEENLPGRIITYNTDDDNFNDVPDKDESGTLTGENDLAQIKLAYGSSSGITGRKVTLLASSGGDKIKVWSTSTKGSQIVLPYIIDSNAVPSVLYVEGVGVGEATLDIVLALSDNTELVRDKAKFTVRDTARPYVSGYLADTQPDPSKVNFTFTFNEAVCGFEGSDVTIGGTASPTIVSVVDSGDHMSYTATVSGMTNDGSVTAMIADGVAQDGAGNDNTASNLVSASYSPLFVPSDVICVNAQGGDDNYDGFAWGRAKKTVQSALASAESSATRKEVWVSEGTYYTLDVYPYAIIIPPGVKLYGGFAGDEAWRDQRDWCEYETILDGSGGNTVVTSSDDLTSSSIVDGFIICNSDNEGISLYNSTLTISHNNISSNYGMAVWVDESSPVISNNYFVDNAYGICLCLSSGAIHDNTITSTSSGAISCSGDNSSISNNTIFGNNDGILFDNSTNVVCNNIIAFQAQKGIEVQVGLAPSLSHNCVYGNATNYIGITDPTGINGNISPALNTPMFVDKDAGNYRLVFESPCIDTGLDAAVMNNVGDYYGLLRVVDVMNRGNETTDVVDIGANEFNLPYVSNVTSSNPDGTYGPGDVITIQVEFSGAVGVSGNPQIELQTGNPGARADFYRCYDKTVEFRYTVKSNDSTADLNYLSNDALILNGGSIKNASAIDVITLLPVPGGAGSLGVNKNIAFGAVSPVTIDQAQTQVDPTGDQVIHFTAIFPVVGGSFSSGDHVVIRGTAGATKYVVTQTDVEGKIFDIAVSGMKQTGTVSAEIHSFDNGQGYIFQDSTSTDNIVEFDESMLPTNVILVDAQNGSDANDGVTWLLAKQTVDAALAAADGSATRKEVWVAAGTYDVPSSGSFELGLNVSMYGGFSGSETQRSQRNWRNNITILQGSGIDQQRNVVNIEQTSTMQSSVIDGFVIQDGACGVVCNADGLIEHNIIKHNKTGISCPSATGGFPTIRNNLITEFVADGIDLGVTDGLVANNTMVTAITVPGMIGDGIGIHSLGELAMVYNNIITGCSVGISADTSLFIYNNDLFANGVDYSGFDDTGSDIHVDALFVDSTNRNYRLFGDSPCIDVGVGGSDSDIDLGGNSHNSDIPGVGNDGTDTCDIGAYEFDGVRVTNVTSDTPDGIYTTGGSIDVRVSFSKPVYLDVTGGSPLLQMATGLALQQATYVSGSGSDTLVFEYQVHPGDTSTDLDYVSVSALGLNGSCITDSDAIRVVPTLPLPGAPNSLSANKAIIIDAAAPLVVDVTSPNEDNHTYATGDNITIQVMLSKPVIVSGSWSLKLDLGNTEPRFANCQITQGATDTLTFTYTVQDGDNTWDLDYTDTQALSGQGTIRDEFGNDAILVLPNLRAAHSLSANKDIVVHACAATSTNFYVTTNGVDIGSGSDWGSAYATIQHALSKAETLPAGTSVTISVAQGLYGGVSIQLRPGISLKGGYWLDTETSSWKHDPVSHETMLIGDNRGSVIHVLPGAGVDDTVIDGFTLTGGAGTYVPDIQMSLGGGIFCDQGSPLISHNKIMSNGADIGGGIVSSQGSPVISNNLIIRNDAYSGGGVYCDGGAPTIMDNTISSNTSLEGGGIECVGDGGTTIINNTIVKNEAALQGGGILNWLSSSVIVNNIVAFNTSGIMDYDDTIPIATIAHNCVYSNPVPDRDNAENQDYCGILPGSIVNPVDSDPVFVDSDNYYHLTSNSPCLDSGDDSWASQGDTDIDGQPRVVNVRRLTSFVDIGADEFVDEVAPAGTIQINEGNDYTDITDVELQLTALDAESGVVEMRFSNDEQTWSEWEPYSSSASWALTDEDGLKTVYVEYRDFAGNVSPSASDTISLDTTGAGSGYGMQTSLLLSGFNLTANPTSTSAVRVKTDVLVTFSTLDSGHGTIDHFAVSTDGTTYSTAGIVWPNTSFDDQLDQSNKGDASSVSYSTTDAYWGKSANFTTGSQYIAYNATKFPTQGTIGFWVKGAYNSARGLNTIFDTSGSSTQTAGDMRMMVTSTNMIQLKIYTSGVWQSVTSTASISGSTWTYVAASYGSSGLKLYVAGTTTTSSVTASRAAHAVYFGDYHGDATSYAFGGFVDCIRVSNTQLDSNIYTAPTAYTMSWPMTQEGKKTVYVRAIDVDAGTVDKNIITYIDKTIPAFTNVVASPTPARNGGIVTITFSTEVLGTVNPTITVNTHPAAYSSKTITLDNSATYTYKYTAGDLDAAGPATIRFSGTDRAGNVGTGANTTALSILGITWSVSPQVDNTGTVKLGWSYPDTCDRLAVEYKDTTGWHMYSLFPFRQASKSDYRVWSMASGSRAFRVRIYESSADNAGFIAGVTGSVATPGILAPFGSITYYDSMSGDLRGYTYTPKY
ncbi:MAG: right-handed parallel beta-helix repeat-containing protein [Armatimonadetes bacterium]|nr:right-handed parallel beta-helix repeat-containing protein [Armatimonadota bacterium]